MRSKAIVPLSLLVALGCVPAVRGPEPAPSPSDLAVLEAERARHPDDAEAMLRLGAAYYRAQRLDRARDVLTAGVALHPSFPMLTYLGLAYEGLARYDSALAVYRRAEPLASSGAERRELESRRIAVTRQALAEAARDAVARERTLAGTAPTPNTVAVLPWTYLGAADSLRPLERGLAHLLVTDLAKVGSLRLLERERVQALVDELELGAGARTEARTAARSGRLLGAERVVQGSFGEAPRGRGVRLDANAVTTTSGRVAATGTATNRLTELFTMEKSVVFALLEQLGITLSPAERQAISERPTQDLQAFLAFSRGLADEDRGDYAAAAAQFSAAARRDPSFREARVRSARAVRWTAALREPARTLAGLAGVRLPDSRGRGVGRAATLRNAIEIVAPSSGSRLARRVLTRSPLIKSRLSELLGRDDASSIGAIGEILITIPRP